MPRDGSGDFELIAVRAVALQVSNTVTINAIDDDIALALTDSINKDGTKAFEGNQDVGGFHFTNMDAGEARSDSPNLAQVQDGDLNWAGATGTVDAITVTYDPPLTALRQGQLCCFRASGANTATAPTFNPNGLGALIIYKNGATALAAGDIAGAGHEVILRLNTTASPDRWELINPKVTVPITATSTTEVLTGTDTAKFVTADALAALWEKGSATASAATTSLAEGGYLHVTGTTTITDIDFATAKDGRAVTVQFDGILTLTHHATTLVLPGGADIVTAAGDTACFVQDSTDNIKCLWYTRASVIPFNAVYAGTAPAYLCRAWVTFDGTGTPAITASGNVTSITDNGVGDYTVNFTTALPNANYALSGSAYHPLRNTVVSIDSTTAPSTTAVRIRVGSIELTSTDADANAYDSTRVSVMIIC